MFWSSMVWLNYVMRCGGAVDADGGRCKSGAAWRDVVVWRAWCYLASLGDAWRLSLWPSRGALWKMTSDTHLIPRPHAHRIAARG
ncbi:hypothetical protein E2C01_037025 [Portunus trituberculatus]|uniref:Secreted protein n=1 Tax=Portunus trituberculatus TaxID=210409 RepID=A0A5B7F892_PORTR|nr:hypothetical protein [Portunus trituberculatus]